MKGPSARALFSGILAKRGDATAQITDAIAFLGYFAACLIAGGVAYSNAYNDTFKFEVRNSSNLFQSATDFSVIVLWDGGYGFLVAVFVILFAILFYTARFVWRLWLGYAALCLFLLLSFAGCIFLGSHEGEGAARADRYKATTTLPEIKLYLSSNANQNAFGDLEGNEKLDSGNYRLLMSDNDRIIIFMPLEATGGEIKVLAIKRSETSYYEVTLK